MVCRLVKTLDRQGSFQINYPRQGDGPARLGSLSLTARVWGLLSAKRIGSGREPEKVDGFEEIAFSHRVRYYLTVPWCIR